MSQNSQPQQHHEGIFEKMFGHHHHQHHNNNNNNNQSENPSEEPQLQPGQQQDQARGQPSQHKESEMDKLRDYYHEDEELESEGQTYGGLM
ncbi:hypothetical protein BO71DRAFT_395151 [Aspergillus ellipticus CBS 707.79]|uniref:Uncharacterized protein n=1 Tax=Aspergillus ellipticus CBS 707.79 TaxID=1448320 RepID=A0A319DLU4_9EURO|nr:hypothetical protein BO71DRAFT_395151 [Aspergillus ellipticus CBS 707.79]